MFSKNAFIAFYLHIVLHRWDRGSPAIELWRFGWLAAEKS